MKSPRGIYEGRVPNKVDPRDPAYKHLQNPDYTNPDYYKYPHDPPDYRFGDKNIELPPVLARRFANSRMLILHRPEHYNPMNLDMISRMTDIIEKWNELLHSSRAIFVSSSSKDFCTGFDWFDLTEQLRKKDRRYHLEFLQKAYQLMLNINNLDTPYVPIMHGLTIGAGAALAMNSQTFSIATEESVFATPGPRFGYVPDCGLSYHLTRMPDFIGVFLALTGKRIVGPDLHHAGISTHFIASDKLDVLYDMLDSDSANEFPISRLTELVTSVSDARAEHPYTLKESGKLDIIKRCFSANSVEEIVARLESEREKWPKLILAGIKKSSPKSLRLTFELLKYAKKHTLLETMRMEYRVASRLLAEPDFPRNYWTAVRDKEPVAWDFKSVAEIAKREAAGEDIIGPFMRSFPNDIDELNLSSVVASSDAKMYTFGGMHSTGALMNTMVNEDKETSSLKLSRPEYNKIGRDMTFREYIGQEQDVNIFDTLKTESDEDLVQLLQSLCEDYRRLRPDKYAEETRVLLEQLNSLPDNEEKAFRIRDLIHQIQQYFESLGTAQSYQQEDREFLNRRFHRPDFDSDLREKVEVDEPPPLYGEKDNTENEPYWRDTPQDSERYVSPMWKEILDEVDFTSVDPSKIPDDEYAWPDKGS
eukprot:TRINITY_DN8473_c0_g1_i1.p1 TRINITY_DN8473_c0_g1~~TRINITY_DN8473_c0_g1_i1.p1  ORF type:complete len:677 (-),score=106.08 TRINITY_DN8473_c0_g1_i1:72-2012(-)